MGRLGWSHKYVDVLVINVRIDISKLEVNKGVSNIKRVVTLVEIDTPNLLQNLGFATLKA